MPTRRRYGRRTPCSRRLLLTLEPFAASLRRHRRHGTVWKRGPAKALYPSQNRRRRWRMTNMNRRHHRGASCRRSNRLRRIGLPRLRRSALPSVAAVSPARKTSRRSSSATIGPFPPCGRRQRPRKPWLSPSREYSRRVPGQRSLPLSGRGRATIWTMRRSRCRSLGVATTNSAGNATDFGPASGGNAGFPNRSDSFGFVADFRGAIASTPLHQGVVDHI